MTVATTTRDAGAAARAYLVFARLFDYPDPAVWAALDQELSSAAGDPAWDTPAFRMLLALDAPDREAAYLDAFELGKAQPYEGHVLAHQGREGVLAELLRFYHFFGLRTAQRIRDYPDHLSTELEFMGFLALKEAQAVAGGDDPGDYRRAQRDFLTRHLRAWVPILAERLAGPGEPSPYAGMVATLAAFLAAEITRLERFADLDSPEGATS